MSKVTFTITVPITEASAEEISILNNDAYVMLVPIAHHIIWDSGGIPGGDESELKIEVE